MRLLDRIQPSFDSELCALIIEIERLCASGASLPTSPLFNDLQFLFFICESVASARIEGNHTTVAEYVDAELSNAPTLLTREPHREIKNLIVSLSWATENVGEWKITEAFVRELHKRAVDGLDAINGEGDSSPGQYRREPVKILNAAHTPPDPGDVPALMSDLLDWLDEPVAPQFQLIRIALAHWRFVWIHPFRNGNGRVARLLTYALLIKRRLIKSGLLFNPTAICCRQREEYYARLGTADRAFSLLLQNETSPSATAGLEEWAFFLLNGVKMELESTARLLNPEFMTNEIVAPALDRARRFEKLLPLEQKIALVALRLGTARLSDVAEELQTDASKRAVQNAWRALRTKGLIMPIRPNGRVFRFAVSPFLYPSIIERFVATNMTLTPLK